MTSDPYRRLGKACEANGLAGFNDAGEMWFQPPADAIEEAAERGLWRPIDDKTPRDRLIVVYAPGAKHDLNDLVTLCQWHEDAGFCVCELREPTHWRPYQPPA